MKSIRDIKKMWSVIFCNYRKVNFNSMLRVSTALLTKLHFRKTANTMVDRGTTNVAWAGGKWRFLDTAKREAKLFHWHCTELH